MDYEIIDMETGEIIGHADTGFTTKEEAMEMLVLVKEKNNPGD